MELRLGYSDGAAPVLVRGCILGRSSRANSPQCLWGIGAVALIVSGVFLERNARKSAHEVGVGVDGAFWSSS